MQPEGQVKGDPGVLSFEKGFIYEIYLSSIDQASHKRDLHWGFCERSQSGSSIIRKGFRTIVAADHDSSASEPFFHYEMPR